MKKSFPLLLSAIIILTSALLTAPSAATVRSETISVNGVELRCDVGDTGMLQITMLREIVANNPNIAIDLRGVAGIVGYTLLFDPSVAESVVIEFENEVKVVLAAANCMQLADNASGESVVLSALYIRADDGKISGVEISTGTPLGNIIEAYGYIKPWLVSLPAVGRTSAAKNVVIYEEGLNVVPRCWDEEGAIFAYICRSGKYTVQKAEAKSFADIMPNWARESVNWLSARGVVLGGDGNLYADRGVTRVEFAQMFVRLLGIHTEITFSETYYNDSAQLPLWSKLNTSLVSILFGVGENDALNPNKVMSRGEMIDALYNYVAAGDLFYSDSNVYLPFSDIGSMSHSELYPLRMLYEMGIIVGDGNGVCLGQSASRGQAMAALYRLALWQLENGALE